MQNNLESTTHPKRNNSGSASSGSNSNSNNSFSAMLNADPFGGPPNTHDFTTLTNHNGGMEFGHLLNSNSNHHHHHIGSNHHPNAIAAAESVNNNNNPVVKPKKQPPPNGKKTKGRVKIKMEFIDNKLRRYTTFSKRKTGIMKKAYELSTLTGTQVMLLVASETGHVYTFATRKLQPMITSEAGKALIQTCLNSPDPPNSMSDTQRMSATGYEETELTYAADPNASEQDIKDDEESESMDSTCEDLTTTTGRESVVGGGTTFIPNGIYPPEFAVALLAAASAAGGNKSGLNFDLISEIKNEERSKASTSSRVPIPRAKSKNSPSSSKSSSSTTTTTTNTTITPKPSSK